MKPIEDELFTVRDWLRHAISRFTEAGLFFGHGCDNAFDEAAWLIIAALHLPRDRLDPFLDARLLEAERAALRELIERRVATRLPAAYLTGEAWLGDFRFRVDPRVIVPRSYFAELLAEGFAPWVDDPSAITAALDLCTGSGCLAVLMAHAWPQACIDATDVSEAALEVARQNVADYALEGRIRVVRSDLFAALAGQRYDFIVCNPPYVTAAAMATLPPEYRHEPGLALAGGDDGLDLVRRIIGQARAHLTPRGMIAIEVGHNRELVERAFPELAPTWIDTPSAEAKIFLLEREQLPAP